MIQFERRRDFGEKINATFTFVTEQIRGLGLSLLFIVGPLALVGGIISGYGQAKLLGSATSVNTPDKLMSFYASILSGPQLIGMVLQLFAYVLTSLVTFSYIRLYREKQTKDSIGVSEVWAEVQRYIGSGILLSIVTSIIMAFAFILLVLPGIYVAVVLTLAPAILVFERREVGQVISRSFKLISDNWWSTFGILLVMGIIVSIMSMVFTLPSAILGGLFGAGVVKDISILTAVLTALASVGGSILQGISATTIAFQYFSLVEEKEGTGLLSQIDSIGQLSTTPGASTSGTLRNREEEGDY
ncbi:hypothetical protein [Fibrella aquatica]|jgi:hypothetical protein|uniref:hypothetical protein n=1 Tax=Fibrella aquatica TaxID=3242487 RepID=UPI003522F0DD